MLQHIIGLTLAEHTTNNQHLKTQQDILTNFPWLKTHTLEIGTTHVCVWGWGNLAAQIVTLPDESTFILVGHVTNLSPNWKDQLRDVQAQYEVDPLIKNWNGQYLLVWVRPQQNCWTFWTDWTGSILTYYAPLAEGRIASTLEPVVVEAANYGPSDFSIEGLVSLFLSGYYFDDWTLYKSMKVIPADTIMQWAQNSAPTSTYRETLQPSDANWTTNWQVLVDEMHERFTAALSESLRTSPGWLLPLSGGMDSRLIAAVGKQIGVDIRAYSYGDWGFKDVIYGHQVTQALGIPWEIVPLGERYLADHAPLWATWFGSSMHFHGMYQMPFLQHVQALSQPIVTGFTGDPLGGAQTSKMAVGERPLLQRFTDKWHLWTAEEVRRLFRIDTQDALSALHAALDAQEKRIQHGAFYQKLWLIFQWNHVSRFSSYQPMMYDYWKGGATPFMNVSLAQFALSLPRIALEDRRLQLEMFRQHYPHLATIGGTFAPRPLELTTGYLMKRTAKSLLPPALHRGPLREFRISHNDFQSRNLSQGGDAAIWPIREKATTLSEWLDMAMVEKAREQAIAGSLTHGMKLTAVQVLAHRL